MIKTKTEQVIDARTNKSAIVYFFISDIHESKINSSISFYIVSATMGEDDSLTPIGEPSKATYKKSTFLQIFGALSLNDFDANIDTNTIGQIDYINSYTPTGEESFPFDKFWNLTSNDLEIV